MLCIKKNKFQSVQTCWNLSKHVSIRSNLSRPVSRLPPLPLLHPPSSPFSTFFLGGREGGRGGSHHHQNPPEGGGTKSPPPPDFNNNNKKQNSLTLSSLCCVIYPYPLEVSLSVHCCCSKLHKHLWRRPLNKIHSLWHTEMIWNLKAPLNIIIIIKKKKKFLLSVVYARWWWSNVNLNSFFLSVFLLSV